MSDVKFDYPTINGYRWADPSPVLEDQLSAFIQTGFFPEDYLIPLPTAEPGYYLADLEFIAPGLYALMYDPRLGPLAEEDAHAVVTALRAEPQSGEVETAVGDAPAPCGTAESKPGKLSYTQEPARSAIESGTSPLRMGHAGPEVADIQRKLAAYDGQVDRLFGPKTRAAVEAFQREQGMEVTGEVDAATLCALKDAPYVRGGAGEPKPTSSSGAKAASSEALSPNPAASVTPATPALDARFDALHCEAKQSLNRALARSGGNDFMAQGAVSELQKIETDAARLEVKGGGSLEGYVTRFDGAIAQTERELATLRSRSIDMYSETGKTEAIGLNAQLEALETQREALGQQRDRAHKDVDGLFTRLEKVSGQTVGAKGVYAQTFETYREREVPETGWRQGAQGAMDASLEAAFGKAREATNAYGQQNPNSVMGEDARQRFTELRAKYEAMKAEGGGGLFGQTSKYEQQVNVAERRVKALVDALGAVDATREPKLAKSTYQELFPRFRAAVDQLTAAQTSLAEVNRSQSELLERVKELEKGYHHPVKMGFGHYAGMR